MEIREIFLDRGKVMEFQTFPIIVSSCWLKSKEIWKTLCQLINLDQASKCSASGLFN